MDGKTLLIIIVAVMVLSYIWEELLTLLNLKHSKQPIPAELAEIYSEEELEKQRKYQKANTRFGFLTSALTFILSLGMIVSGGFAYVDNLVISWVGKGEIVSALVFVGVLFLAQDILTLPFQWYSTFKIEERFGFNKMTPKTFILDKIKGYFLAGIFGGLILWAMLALIIEMGENFWIIFWAVIAVLMLLLNMFYASLIVPLFNKLTPLEDGDLKTAIQNYCSTVNFSLDNVFVIDGSKRSSKANAFFSGMGKKKKVVLYDTLIESTTTEELVAVIAHEIGHYKKKHIIYTMVLSVLNMGFILFVLSKLLFNKELSVALGADDLRYHLNLITFGLLFSPISKIVAIFMNLFSRKNEFEADAYATTTFNGTDLISALKKLAKNNLSNLHPHPLFAFYHYSHPPLKQRFDSIKKYSKG